jgi:hypothetical protein
VRLAASHVMAYLHVYDKPAWMRSWFCTIHGHVGDINGPVHYAVCQIIRSMTRQRERAEVSK